MREQPAWICVPKRTSFLPTKCCNRNIVNTQMENRLLCYEPRSQEKVYLCPSVQSIIGLRPCPDIPSAAYLFVQLKTDGSTISSFRNTSALESFSLLRRYVKNISNMFKTSQKSCDIPHIYLTLFPKINDD